MKPKLFISYSRADSAFAVRLVRDLKERGLQAWLDQLDIPPGVNWDTEIENALSAADTMLLLLSDSAAASENVKNEISHALELKKQVIPIMLGAKSVPLIITRLQREDFTGPYEAALEKLLRRLHAGGRTASLDAIAAQALAAGPASVQRTEAERAPVTAAAAASTSC